MHGHPGAPHTAPPKSPSCSQCPPHASPGTPLHQTAPCGSPPPLTPHLPIPAPPPPSCPSPRYVHAGHVPALPVDVAFALLAPGAFVVLALRALELRWAAALLDAIPAHLAHAVVLAVVEALLCGAQRAQRGGRRGNNPPLPSSPLLATLCAMPPPLPRVPLLFLAALLSPRSAVGHPQVHPRHPTCTESSPAVGPPFSPHPPPTPPGRPHSRYWQRSPMKVGGQRQLGWLPWFTVQLPLLWQ